MAESTEGRRRRRARRRDTEQQGDAGELGLFEEGAELTGLGTTGRYLVLLREDAVPAGIRALTEAAGVSVASAADFAGGAVDAGTLDEAEALVFPELGVAVVDALPEQVRGLSALAAEESGILAIEPERVVYALEGPRPAAALPAAPATGLPVDYLLGYRDAVNFLVERVTGAGGAAAGLVPESRMGVAAFDETQLTWGLQVTNVAASPCSGRGVRVAVLDTGLDLGHPDFAGRQITSQSFVVGQQVQDGHGHGTHCIGTACGPKQPQALPRYGIAFQAEIFAGKVLSNQGSGTDEGILAGLNWAVTNGCAVVSMSLGARTFPGQAFSQVFEAVAQRALAAGTVIVGVASGDSNRRASIAPATHPAKCPAILAVGVPHT